MTFQIAAQELSDNRVITLSLAGRKLDKKVSQAGRGFHEQLCFLSPGPWDLASLATPFSFPMGVRLSTEPHKSDFLPLWGESVLPLKGKQTVTGNPLMAWFSPTGLHCDPPESFPLIPFGYLVRPVSPGLCCGVTTTRCPG